VSLAGRRLDAQLLQERADWRRAGTRVVVTNGCFDLLHSGHVALLEKARALGDVLVVALLPEAERAELLQALEPVDRVVIYDEETPLEVVRALLPDVLVKGADWGPDNIVGSDVVKAHGGEVVRVELVPGCSTSAILERVRRS
jgi:cytidyltransferase-like protein